MDQSQTQLQVTEELVDYFPNQRTQCFRPHCKPNKQMLEHFGIANLQPINSQESTDFENDTRSKVSDPLDFPYSAIGFLSLKYGQSKYIGSGFLVGLNIVLTAARNLYIHSLQKQCEQVKFYPCLHSQRECKVKKFYYPPQYKSITPDKRGEFDFAILELKDGIGLEYGYFGVDFRDKKENWLSENAHVYGYPESYFDNRIQLDVRHFMYGNSGKWVKESENHLKYEIPTSAGQCGSPIYIKVAQNSYNVVGIHTNEGIASNQVLLLNMKIKATINKWIQKIIKTVILQEDDIIQENGKIKQKEFRQIIKKIQEKQINKVILRYNKIGAEGAKFLSQANWPALTYISLINTNMSLGGSKIGAEGAKFLSQANWPSLTQIDLGSNNIDAEGAKFLSRANWPSLTQIDLGNNKIDAEGARFLSQANWSALTQIYLGNNSIGAEGVKFLSRANWPSLTIIDLDRNSIGAEGVKFFSQVNWPSLTQIGLWSNSIGAEGAKFLSLVNWPSLTQIYLGENNIGVFGKSFLKSVSWSAQQNFEISF